MAAPPHTLATKLKVIDNSPIVLPSSLKLDIADIHSAVDSVNGKLRLLADTTSTIAFNIFEVLDFRMLSGMVGESLVSTLAATIASFEKNPNIDGYPDLLDASREDYRADIEAWLASEPARFIAYPHGGIEVKNTFGTKKSGRELAPGEQRIDDINPKLDWKAHHRSTNSLLATFSDFVGDCPQIVAVMYADDLTEEDWAEKQNPGEGSTMTSFSVIKKSGFDKLRDGLRLCLDDQRYLAFVKAR